MIAGRWPMVAADLRSEYAMDVYDHAMMRATSWLALQSMIGGLFCADTRIARWYDREYGKSKA